MKGKPTIPDPIDDPLVRAFVEARGVRDEISARLDEARALPAALSAERQALLVDAARGIPAATSALQDINRRVSDSEQTISDLTSALAMAGDRVTECSARLGEAKQRVLLRDLDAVVTEQSKLWSAIEEAALEMRSAYTKANTLRWKIVGLRRECGAIQPEMGGDGPARLAAILRRIVPPVELRGLAEALQSSA